MALRARSENLDGLKLAGMVLVHPYFWGKRPIGCESDDINKRRFLDELWRFANPLTSGSDDPLMNPALEPNLKGLACSRVLVCVAERDRLRDRGFYYHEALGKSGWDGKVQIMESKGEGHAFHLFDSSCEDEVALRKRLVSLLNLDCPK